MSAFNTPGGDSLYSGGTDTNYLDEAAETPGADSVYSGETDTNYLVSSPRPNSKPKISVMLPGDKERRPLPDDYVYGATFVDNKDDMEIVVRVAQVMTDGSQAENPFIFVMAADGKGHRFPGQHKEGLEIKYKIAETEDWKTDEDGSKGDRIRLTFYRQDKKEPYSWMWGRRRKPTKADL